jgi:hypothetical protein
MNAEQQQRALQMLRRFEQAAPMSPQVDNAAVDMAALLHELIDAPEQPTSVPVLTVECEPAYWSRGHYYEGTKPHIDPTAVWKLPIGTELYTSPVATEHDLLGPADEIVKRYNAYPKLLQLISDARDELVQLSFCEDGLDELIEELTKARE